MNIYIVEAWAGDTCCPIPAFITFSQQKAKDAEDMIQHKMEGKVGTRIREKKVDPEIVHSLLSEEMTK